MDALARHLVDGEVTGGDALCRTYRCHCLLSPYYPSGQEVEIRCAAVYALGSLYSRAPNASATSTAATATRAVTPGGPWSSSRGPRAAVASRQGRGRGAGVSLQEKGISGPSPADVAGSVGVPGGNVGGDGVGLGQRGGGAGWSPLVPEYSVAETSETKRVDELGIATRLTEHSGDARCC